MPYSTLWAWDCLMLLAPYNLGLYKTYSLHQGNQEKSYLPLFHSKKLGRGMNSKRAMEFILVLK